MSDFIHLHNHSHFSLLDAAITVDSLVNAAVENKMPALALTDHGVLFGAVEFFKLAKSVGIKPIIGCEMYVAKGTRFEKEIDSKSLAKGQGRGIYQHIVLLAKNLTGYRNLIKLCSLAHIEGYYYKPRIDDELLKMYCEGLIALSGCPAGIVSTHLVAGNYEEAKRSAIKMKELFGNDFYLEIQSHGLEKDKLILEGMPRLAKELGIKLVATNDIHYLKREHSIAHNVMLLIPDAVSSTTSYRQLRYQTEEYYFKSSEQMCELFKDYPEAIESTLEITEKIEPFSILSEKVHMPNFPIPEDAGILSLEKYFEQLARKGIESRYKVITPEILARLEHEISVINKMGYAGYFLITQDFIQTAKKKGILVGPGRGSAAGSIVSYALGITDIDPLKYDLLFERFLNPDRVSLPDIDVDFSDDKRDQIIDYVKDKYGTESVSQIITFGTLSSRAVIKDVGRVLGIPLATTEAITKFIPVVQGKVTPLAEALDSVPELKWVKESQDEKIQELINVSLILEGMNRTISTHAAGVVIAPGPIIDYVPLYKTPQTYLMTQYNMNDLKEVGLLKMDFLGLRTLTIIANTIVLIQKNHGVEIKLEEIPEDDAKTFELFSKGHTSGIFQFESPGMREWLSLLKPTCISDLVAMNALYRPGPMEMIGDFIERKQGKQKIEYLHPKLEPILKETYGIIVYQEQVMKIASEIAGFSLAKADLMRLAMGKKDKALMKELKMEFIEGAMNQGFSEKISSEIFDTIEKFASYGFNKAHSVAYSIIAYRTAYLKAHFPFEFMAATLSAEIGDIDYMVELMNECRKMEIPISPPDINESYSHFIVKNNKIYFGLSAIKNVGISAVENIVKARELGGKFKNLFDFCSRVDLRSVNKKTIESFIQAGAFDSLGFDRAQLFDSVEKAIQFGQKMQEMCSKGQEVLFGSDGCNSLVDQFPSMPNVQKWSTDELLKREKNVLGFYLSGHPLNHYSREVQAFSTVQLGYPNCIRKNQIIRVCGIISDVRKKIDKKGNTMAFLTIEDFTGKGDCIVFSDTYKNSSSFIHNDSLIMVIGKAEVVADTFRIIAQEIYPIDVARQKFAKGIIISIDVDKCDEQVISRLREIAEKNYGKCLCYFNVTKSSARDSLKLLSTKYSIELTNQFLEEVEKLFSSDSIQIFC